jgi:hypothetical protein
MTHGADNGGELENDADNTSYKFIMQELHCMRKWTKKD